MYCIVPQLQLFAEQAMGRRWSAIGVQFLLFVALILGRGLRGTSSLNLEGLNLMKFRAYIESDPYHSLANWDSNSGDACGWLGVYCIDGEVHILDLSGLSLGGTLAPELGNLGNLRALILHTNHFSGAIPVEFKHLSHLEVLDLRDNNLNGIIPAEITKLVSLKTLLLGNNNFEGIIPPELEELSLLTELQYDEYLESVPIRNSDLGSNSETNTWLAQQSSQNGNLESSYGPHLLQKAHDIASLTRRQLAEQSSNVEAMPDSSSSDQIDSQPVLRSSGSFPAADNQSPFKAPIPTPSVSNTEQVNKPPQPKPTAHSEPAKGRPSQKVWVYVAVALGVVFLLAVAAALFFLWRSRSAKPIGPFKTGISGQLQKAFITGVPKLNRPELETACEDFSNIVATFDAYTIYKGTLSSGVEIAVASTVITSLADWSEAAELAYRKKIETLSRVNHKNFVNLLGYCEEQEPFTRMMVFEYAPSGSLFEHLHVEEVENLDWNARIRLIMGTAYCLQYMHHDLSPPVTHSKLSSATIYLTDDYAAKISEQPFDIIPKSKESLEDGPKPVASLCSADPRQNVYDFGIMLLEVITGRLPSLEDGGSLVDWAAQYLGNKEINQDLIDPIIKSIKPNELNVICEIILECIRPNPSQRPTMQEITTKLRGVIPIAPDAAVPRLSPLWWAELEILSVEAT